MAVERKNLFVLDDNDLFDYMFYDIKNNSNVGFLNFKYDIKSKVLKAFNRVHTSVRLSKKIPVPFKSMWFKKSNLYNYQFDPNYEYNLIFMDTSIILLTLPDIKRLQKKINFNIILLFLNPVSGPSGGYAYKYINHFPIKKIYTIEPQDCKTYGYTYVNTIYSKYPIQKSEIEGDILFVGRAKNRLAFLHELAQKLKREGITYRFFIFGVKNEEQVDDPNIIYNKYIPYEKVLEYVEQSKYILELLQEGQTGVSFRCYECYLYDRVLVTNNSDVPAEFKDMNIIKYENTVDLIESLKNYQFHSYEIDDRFSPVHFLSMIHEG